MRQTNKTDWFEHGFSILRNSGAADLTIDHLTTKLKKTKGAFYHHFKNRNDYVQQLLSFWEEQQTYNIIETSRRKTTFKEINNTLLELSKENMDPPLEVAIRAWALRDPMVRKFQKRIDTLRVNFLRSMFALATRDPEKVEMISLIRYCLYVGSQQVIPAIDKQTYQKSLNILMEMFEIYINQGIPNNQGDAR